MTCFVKGDGKFYPQIYLEGTFFVKKVRHQTS